MDASASRPPPPPTVSPPGRRPRVLPSRKPMARARRVSLFEREIAVRLSSAAVDILFDLAWVLSEGATDDGRYQGSTMITFDLTRAAVRVSDECDLATARDLERLIASDPRIDERARALAVRESERTAGGQLRAPDVDLRVRRTGRHFYIDLDVEGDLARAPLGRGTPGGLPTRG